MALDVQEIAEKVQSEGALLARLREEIGRVIVGQSYLVDRLLLALLANNHVLIEGLASPVGRFYRLLIPRFVRDRLRDFSANLLWPRNLAANLLQARWPEAGSETLRFGINSTLGAAGLWDPAKRWWGIEPRPEDFGQVFANWGWRPSTYVVLPLYGPSTPRDAVESFSRP